MRSDGYLCICHWHTNLSICGSSLGDSPFYSSMYVYGEVTDKSHPMIYYLCITAFNYIPQVLKNLARSLHIWWALLWSETTHRSILLLELFRQMWLILNGSASAAGDHMGFPYAILDVWWPNSSLPLSSYSLFCSSFLVRVIIRQTLPPNYSTQHIKSTFLFLKKKSPFLLWLTCRTAKSGPPPLQWVWQRFLSARQLQWQRTRHW